MILRLYFQRKLYPYTGQPLMKGYEIAYHSHDGCFGLWNDDTVVPVKILKNSDGPFMGEWSMHKLFYKLDRESKTYVKFICVSFYLCSNTSYRRGRGKILIYHSFFAKWETCELHGFVVPVRLCSRSGIQHGYDFL